MLEIPKNPEMSQHIHADLVRRTKDGYEPIDFSQRARLDSLYVRVARGTGPLPHLNTILAKGEIESMTEDTGDQNMTL